MAATTSAKAIVKSAWKIIPKFPCASVADTVDFYTNTLHFDLGGVYSHDDDSHEQEQGGDDEESKKAYRAKATMCSVAIGKKSDANIYFFKKPAGFPPSEAMIALGTQELDLYYDRLVEEGKVTVTEAIEDKPWGYRQFEIMDIDGNLIQFFKFLEGGNPGGEE